MKKIVMTYDDFVFLVHAGMEKILTSFSVPIVLGDSNYFLMNEENFMLVEVEKETFNSPLKIEMTFFNKDK